VNLRSVSKPLSFAAVIPFLVVVAAGWFAWHGTWRGEWVYDDLDAIAQNRALLAGDWWNGAFGPQHQPLANRPLACLSLVLDARLFGPGPFGPHLGNFVLHLVNATLLLLVVRGCLRAPALAGRFTESRATWLAASIAALWVAHPLGADAVCYATQRSTLLFSGALLVSILATLRSHAGERRRWWQGIAVVAMAAAMASKEDAVIGPFLVVLLERAFVVSTWRELRARRAFHVAMASTWLVLLACVWLGPSNATVGYATAVPVTAFQWLLTQAGVVAGYVRLAAWPHPLRTAYDTAIVTNVAAAALPGLFVLGLLAVTIGSWRRRPWWGFVGAVFFLLLAPTSTIMPIVSEVVAERRAYLPMLLVVVPAVFAVDALLAGNAARVAIAAVAVTAAVVGLGSMARSRVAVYRDPGSFWSDAWEKRDPTSRSYVAGVIAINRGDVAYRSNRAAEAFACYDAAMSCEAQSATAKGRHAMSLLERDRPAEAVESLRRLAKTSGDASTLGMLGIALLVSNQKERAGAADPRLAEAEEVLQRSLAMDEKNAQFWGALAEVRAGRGRMQDAAAAARRSKELEAAAPRTR